MDDKALFAGFWETETTTTRKVFARIPEGSDYRPDPKSRTAGEIAWQIICEETMLIDALETSLAANPSSLRLVRVVQCRSELVEFRLIENKDVVLLLLVGVARVLGNVVRISQVVARVVGIHPVRVLDHGFDVGRELDVRRA